MTARATIPPGVLFVTGGARGLGHAIALAFAREGCTGVAVVDVLPDNELKSAEAAVVELGAQVQYWPTVRWQARFSNVHDLVHRFALRRDR